MDWFTHLPNFVMIISVPIWWNCCHNSAFSNSILMLGSDLTEAAAAKWRWAIIAAADALWWAAADGGSWYGDPALPIGGNSIVSKGRKRKNGELNERTHQQFLLLLHYPNAKRKHTVRSPFIWESISGRMDCQLLKLIFSTHGRRCHFSRIHDFMALYFVGF